MDINMLFDTPRHPSQELTTSNINRKVIFQYMNPQYSKTNFWDKSKNTIRSDILVNPFIIKAIGNVKNKAVLDVGCGDGTLTEHFAKRGAKITGIDSNKNILNFTEGKKGKYLLGDLTKLKFPANSFDKIYSAMVFLHLNTNHLEKAFLEAYRVLKPGGDFVVGDVHPSRLTQKEAKLVKHKNKGENYFSTHRVSAVLTSFNKNRFVLNYYHRSLSTYINTALKSGFVLKSLVEPKPTKQQIRKFGKLLETETKQPSYIVFVFRKE